MPNVATFEELHDLATRAKKPGYWLFHPYQDMWFSPNEFIQIINQGKFLWKNWEMKDPQILIDAKKQSILNTADEIVNIRLRMTHG